jgi:hypothetical protein
MPLQRGGTQLATINTKIQSINEETGVMVAIIALCEWTTKATLTIMFHSWYLCGVWLSQYIIVNETDELTSHFPGFDTNGNRNDRTRDYKSVDGHEDIS